MKRVVVCGSLATAILIVLVLGLFSRSVVGEQEMPFGGKADVEFANKLWTAMKGYDNWPMKSDVYPGKSPHGKFLRTYFNIVNIDKKHYPVIIKDNFGGEGATMDTVSASPEKYLVAVTIMAKREAGYDADNDDWFWVKYKPDGTIDKNPKDMALAGRVAKGTDTGCIACHAKAEDNDYFFTNDKKM